MSFISRLIAFIFNVLLIWWIFKTFFGERAKFSNRNQDILPPEPPRSIKKDPYEILGLRRDASKAEIKEAYHQKLQEYHPDKVNHLGEDLKTLAQNITLEIMNAYELLKQTRNDL